MARLLTVMIIFFSFAQASGQKYFIKFGSFKKLKGLERTINRLPKSLRSHVMIVRSGSWYVPFAYYSSKKKPLYSKVRGYKHYFPDAHIAHSKRLLKNPLIRNYTKSRRHSVPRVRHQRSPVVTTRTHSFKQPTRPLAVHNVNVPKRDYTVSYLDRQPTREVEPQNIPTTIITPPVVEGDGFGVVEYKQYTNFNKKMLSGQHYYLASKSNNQSPNLLIKVSFGSEEVTYQPIIGEMKMTQAKYLVDHNRLYMFANDFDKNGAYSILEAHRQNHFLVSSWSNGKKLHTLRYYYLLNDAKRYLGIPISTGLSNILEEGDFSNSFLSQY